MQHEREIKELLYLLDCEPDADRRWQLVNVLRELLNNLPETAVKERRQYGYPDRRRYDASP